MNYQQAVDYIHGLGRFGSKPGLARIAEALAHLGNPQDSLNIIHVAGTNGKGSTCSILASILSAAGLHVGLYTSPYLDAFTNRFGLDGKDISPDELVALVEELKPAAERVGLTQFEFITALAFHYYKLRQVDALVLEVGLGGRFDATNVVMPLVSVITNIGFDHMEVLGHTLGEIAFEKAGIIKPKVPVVSTVDAAEACAVIKEVATKNGAPLRAWPQDFTFQAVSSSLTGQLFHYSGRSELKNLELGLLGPHQLVNASLAVDVALGLPFPVSEEQVRRGLREAKWPGRFEVMRRSPWLIMDGAHNTHGVAALCESLKTLLPGQRVRLVSGILKDKEPREMLTMLSPYVLKVYASSPNIPRATEAKDLAQMASELGLLAVPYPSVSAALQAALTEAGPADVVLVAGSLYTVSEARAGLATI